MGFPYVFPIIFDPEYIFQLDVENEQTFFSKALRNRVVIPNIIEVKSPSSSTVTYAGTATDSSTATLEIWEFAETAVDSNAEAEDIAEALLSKYQLHAETGAADTPMNVGAEVFDFIKVVDSREDDSRIGNIGKLTRHINANKGEWRMSFSFGGWLSIRKLSGDLEIYPTGEQSIGEDTGIQQTQRTKGIDFYYDETLAARMRTTSVTRTRLFSASGSVALEDLERPNADDDAATKLYVDTEITGVDAKLDATVTDYSASGRVLGTIYQNTTGYRLYVAVSLYIPINKVAYFQIGSASPPTTQVGQLQTFSSMGDAIDLAFTFIVPDNYYYRVSVSAGITINNWVEWSPS